MSVLPESHLDRAANSTNVRLIDRPAIPPALRVARGAVRWIGGASPDAAAAVALRVFGTPRQRPRPAHEHELLERAHRRDTIRVAGRSITTWQWGEAGPVILLLHGWEGRAAQLGAFALPLAELGYRVIGFDAPAHGDSGGATTSFVDFSRTLEAVLDRVGKVHAIVGHSMGAAVMAWTASRRPFAKRYVAIAPPRAVADFVRSFEDLVGMSPEVRAAFERRIERLIEVPIDSIRTDASEYPTAPLLVIHDAKDREVPFAFGETLARHWPGSHLHRTEGLGHQRILRDEGVVEAVKRFVAWGSLPETQAE